MADAGSQEMMRQAMSKVAAESPDLATMNSKMHALSFLYMSYLRERNPGVRRPIVSAQQIPGVPHQQMAIMQQQHEMQWQQFDMQQRQQQMRQQQHMQSHHRNQLPRNTPPFR